MNIEGPKSLPCLQDLNKIILPLKVMAHTVIAKQRTMHDDFEFFKDVISIENNPEFNGHNTKLCRLAGFSVPPRNKAVYMHLINMSPAYPSTMMTAFVEANRLTSEAGKEFTIFICHQQLYRVSLQVICAYPQQFSSWISWCWKMLNGEKFPQNVIEL